MAEGKTMVDKISVTRSSVRPNQSGVSLIEVLVTVLILAIGLLGLASLQANALQMNQGANMRSQATGLAYDIADRMRANRPAALDGDYDTDWADVPDCAVPNLDGDIANRDLTEWRLALACALPQGQGRITTTGNTMSIQVRWDNSRLEDGVADNGGVEMFETRTSL